MRFLALRIVQNVNVVCRPRCFPLVGGVIVTITMSVAMVITMPVPGSWKGQGVTAQDHYACAVTPWTHGPTSQGLQRWPVGRQDTWFPLAQCPHEGSGYNSIQDLLFHTHTPA